MTEKDKAKRVIEIALELGELRTRAQMLEIHADGDGRVRAGYNIVGTETGRLTCYTSPTGSGYNLQTIPAENLMKDVTSPIRNGMRDLFTADEDFYFFQCDLKGADGWTVGAYMAMLGDRTMLDDLLFGLKPASIVCYLFRHGGHALDGKQRTEIKELLKEIKKDDWDYFACKCGIWGTCYLMGPQKLSNLIFIQSEGKVYLSLQQSKDFQAAVFSRYRVRTWHSWMGQELKRSNNTLTAPNGFKRRFFGRADEILGQALAHLPQVITTWATNMAMFRLWTDRENRNENKLHAEPLHQVHDALAGQFKKDKVEWAKIKIPQWFNNEIVVAGIRLIIPYEGSYGTNWALDNKSKIGDI